MPTLTKVCAWATCQRIANTGRYCADHAKAADERKRNNRKHYDRRQYDSEYNAQRTALEAFYGRKAWRSARADVLRTEPLCRMCAHANRTTAATIVDHIQPLKARPDLALERTNLQPLCRPCHHIKTQQDAAATGNTG